MSSERHVKLSVIVCSEGRDSELRSCLAALRRQEELKGIEVVVVSRNKLKFGEGRVDVRWVKDPGEGLARARDVGWRKARGEIVAWVDDDVVVSRYWARNIVRIFDENSDIGGVSGPTIVPEELLSNRAVFFWYRPEGVLMKILAWLWVKLVLCNRPYEVGRIYWHGWWSPGSNFPMSLEVKELKDVDYLEACNMSLRRELVRQVGGYDLRYKGTSEWCEVDLARRVKRLGYRLVFSSKAKVEHRVSKSGVYSNRRRVRERVGNYLRYYWRLRG